MGLLDVARILFKAGTSRFSDFERLVLSHVATELPADLQERFQRRIEAVNLVQRINGGREVNCFVMSNGKPTLDLATRIDFEVGEKLLAKFAIDARPGTENTGKIWLVDGNLFSIEFDQATEHAEPSAVVGVRIDMS